MNRIPLLVVASLLLVVMLSPVPATGLVNPHFTLVDLEGGSAEILVLRVSPPRNEQFTAEIVETLAGEQDDQAQRRTIVFDLQYSNLSEEQIASMFDDDQAATGVMFVPTEQDEDIVGSLQIGTTWMGLIEIGENKWEIVRDPLDLETVWAGSARQLVRAVRYVQNDRSAEFPVGSGLSWRSSRKLGTLQGPARGHLLIDAGIVVLCDAGDRVYRPGQEGAAPTDVTERLGLTSNSRALAAVDINSDGRADLASWDGEKIRSILRKPDGTFAAPSDGTQLPECLSLDAVGGTLVAAGTQDIAVLTPEPDGTFRVERLPTPPDAGRLGAGGVAAVADFNDDGLADVLHVFEKGLAFYAGADAEQRFTAPVVHQLDVVAGAAATVCGDFDTDGQLDVLVAGEGGVTLLSRNAGGEWQTRMEETGELAAAMGGGRDQAAAVDASAADLSGDGRQSVAIFSAEAAPGLFYARGFACFAVAISLTRSAEPVEGYEALTRGQQAGAMTDLNGDLAPDLFGVDVDGNVWAALTEPERPRRSALTLSPPSASGPVTVKVALGERLLGMHVLRPGQPTTLGLPRAGKYTLSWKMPDGEPASRDVVVTRHVQLGDLTPARHGRRR